MERRDGSGHVDEPTTSRVEDCQVIDDNAVLRHFRQSFQCYWKWLDLGHVHSF